MLERFCSIQVLHVDHSKTHGLLPQTAVNEKIRFLPIFSVFRHTQDIACGMKTLIDCSSSSDNNREKKSKGQGKCIATIGKCKVIVDGVKKGRQR